MNDTTHISVYKHSASRYGYTIHNKGGGSFSSTSYKSQRAALTAGTFHLAPETTVPVIFQQWDPETEEYVTTKSIYFTKGY